MKEIAATITGRGQVTLPAEVRRLLGARKGGKVLFRIEDTGVIQIEKLRYPNVASVRGVAGSLDRPLSWAEMREIVREDRAAEVARRLK